MRKLKLQKRGPLRKGDQELHEKKLQRTVGNFRPAEKEEVKDILGVEAGFIGPHNRYLKMIADISLKEGMFISGANRAGFHTRGLKPGVHFTPEWQDIHIAGEGDGCPECGADLIEKSVIEIGNIFKLGTKYSKSLKAVYLDENGIENPIIMGSYGIGPARIAAAAIEQNNDRDGMIWPQNIAPFDVEIIPLDPNIQDIKDTAEVLYNQLKENNIDAVMDDRDERPGIKFKDADLIGIPFHIIIGKKTLADGLVEVKTRKTKETEKIPPSEAVKRLKSLIRNNS